MKKLVALTLVATFAFAANALDKAEVLISPKELKQYKNNSASRDLRPVVPKSSPKVVLPNTNLPGLAEPTNASNKKVWDECSRLSASSLTPYSYQQGTLKKKSLFVVPSDCFENCPDRKRQYILSMELTGRTDIVSIGLDSPESEFGSLQKKVELNKSYVMCVTYSDRLLKQGVVKYSTPALYIAE